MVRTDAYTPGEPEYECVRCGARLESRADTCDDPFCDGAPRNIGVERE
ncbi:hypothetical protein [Halorubellus sp. PRR65]|nr:hypothetical protein [Halorubellus sp. PRR65]